MFFDFDGFEPVEELKRRGGPQARRLSEWAKETISSVYDIICANETDSDIYERFCRSHKARRNIRRQNGVFSPSRLERDEQASFSCPSASVREVAHDHRPEGNFHGAT